MNPSEITDAKLAVAAALAPPEISLWSVFWDPVFLFVLLVTIALIGISAYNPLARRHRRKQTDYLDHQREVNEKALAQNKTMEDIIARQYAETNARSDKALEQAEISLRLHAEALAELRGVNQAMARLTALIAAERGGHTA